MRTRSQGTEAEPETQPQAEGTTPAKAPVEYKPEDRVNLGVGMPFALKQIIEKEASGKNVSASAWARDFLADHFKYTLPEGHKGGGKKKYATDEERDAARENATKRRAALVKVMMKKYGDNPEILAEVEKMLAEQAEEEAKKAAEAPAEATTA